MGKKKLLLLILVIILLLIMGIFFVGGFVVALFMHPEPIPPSTLTTVHRPTAGALSGNPVSLNTDFSAGNFIRSSPTTEDEAILRGHSHLPRTRIPKNREKD